MINNQKQGLIISLRAGNYFVKIDNDIYKCKARGLFRHQDISPVVGDNVIVEIQNYQEGYIIEILERHNYLARPKIANIDCGIIITSYDEPQYSYYLIDKFLAILEFLKIEPIICVTKIDLASDIKDVYASFKSYEYDNYQVVYTSINDAKTFKSLKEKINNKLTVLIGQSGAGKSSLLNAINKNLNLQTNEISQSLNRGKHTTRHVEIFETNYGLIADSPGFSSLDLDMMQAEDLAIAYHDFKDASTQCKFNNCLHLNEPQCMVKELVKDNKISLTRYNNYLLFQEEIKNRKVRY
ncbi:MAG: ribosome small subunit-dependent GTPase A [Bacilli bacterium]|jgi:ribosome biogenesis GTPase|nr:ribosome small subunit-dependent GTPase A [Bacilli bacterium]